MSSKIFAKKVYTGNSVLENQSIYVENGRIAGIQPCSALPIAAPQVDHICPGFLDIQVNGGAHFHFTSKPDEACLRDIDEACIHAGTAFVLPTMITASFDHILRGIQAIQTYKLNNPFTSILGMHLEGPFLNPVKRGAHLIKYIQKPNRQTIEELLSIENGVIRQMTVAPEVFEDGDLQLLLDSGIAIAAGHSNATYEEAVKAFDAGISQVTHLYNAMSPFLHRASGLVGATFNKAEVFAPLVLDGKHCSFSAAAVAYKIKKEKLFLISDALFLGREKKDFVWEEFDAKLIDDAYVNSDGNLAGAAISLADAVRNAVQILGLSIREAVEMATIRPAMAVGLSDQIGKLEIGYPARFTIFDDRLENFKVLTVD